MTKRELLESFAEYLGCFAWTDDVPMSFWVIGAAAMGCFLILYFALLTSFIPVT